MPNLEFLDYTDKSFVIRGPDTREYKEYLKSEGGRFNPSLIDPSTKERFAGWIFPLPKKDYVYNMLFEGKNQKYQPSMMEPIEDKSDILLHPNTETLSKPRRKKEINENIQCQNIEFNIETPQVGQSVFICVKNKQISGKITSTIEEDNVTIEAIMRVDDGDLPSIFKLRLGYRQWYVVGTLVEHDVEFV